MIVRHILPGHGRVPKDLARESASGLLGAVLGLATVQAGSGKAVEIYGWRPGKLRDTYILGKTRVTTSSGIPGLYLGKYDWRYYAALKLLLCVAPVADIMHVHAQPYQLKLGKCRKKILHLHYDIPFQDWPRALIGEADCVVCVSRFLRDRFLEGTGYPAERTFVVYNGVNLSRFRGPLDVKTLRAQWGVSPDETVVLFSGALVPEKGVHCLLKAWRSVCLEHSKVRLVLVGSPNIWQAPGGSPDASNYSSRLHSEAHDLPVHFAGEIPFQEMPSVYRACDICVIPSIVPEGLSLTALEAMAAAKPVVASRIGGIPEVVVHGETGFLVPPGEPEAIAYALKVLLENPDLAKKLGQTGYRRVSQSFAWSKVEKQMEQVYHTALRLSGELK